MGRLLEALDRLGPSVRRRCGQGGRRQKPSANRRQGSRPRRLEPLEQRALLSIGVAADPADLDSRPMAVDCAGFEDVAADHRTEVWVDFPSAAPAAGSGLPADGSYAFSYVEKGVRGRVSLPGVLLERVAAEGLEFARLEVPGWGTTTAMGRAELPTFRTSVVVPDGAEVFADYTVEATVDLGSGYLVYPVQAPYADVLDENGTEPAHGFAWDASYYSGAAVSHPELLTVSDPMIARGQSLVFVSVAPFQYNPLTGEITVATEIRWSLEFVEAVAGGGGLNEAVEQDAVAPAGDQDVAAGAAEADYLIITADQYYDEVQPLAAWKQKKGFRTYVALMSELGGTDEDVADFISSAYHAGTPTSYVLIVGDHEDVPGYEMVGHIYHGASHIWHTDYPYACVEGEDLLADLAIGRLPAESESQVATMVEKILGYERTPDGGDWYDDVMVAAYFQDGEIGTSERMFMESVHRVADFLGGDWDFWGDPDPYDLGYTIHTALTPERAAAEYHYDGWWYPGRQSPPDPVPTVWTDLWTSEALASNAIGAAVDDGVSLVLHRDHGSSAGWVHPPFSVTNVEGLANGAALPLVLSLNCETGRFDTADCFAEAWLRHAGGGGIGVVAPVRVSYTGFNDALTLGLFDGFWDSADPTWTSTAYPASWRPAAALNRAKARILEAYGVSNAHAVLTVRMFNWFGDPEMMFRTEVPGALSVEHPAVFRVGAGTDVTVEVTDAGGAVEGARVCISKVGTDDYWVGVTDSGGNAIFPDLCAVEVGEYDVVVTAHDALPYEGTIRSVAEGPFGRLVDPAANVVTNVDRGCLDVRWLDFSGTGLDTTTIDPGDLSITGVSITAVAHQGADVWRYTYTGALPQGLVEALLHAGQVQDNRGDGNVGRTVHFFYDTGPPSGSLQTPAAGTEIYVDPGYVDVLWTDAGVAGVDPATLDTGDVTIDGVTITGPPADRGDGVWRYGYAGNLPAGIVTVRFLPGEVLDLAGNPNPGHVEVFTFSPLQITTPAGLPTAVQAEPYEVTFAAQGGVDPYEWSLPLPIVITEIDLGNPDVIEIQNTSGQPVNTSGWVVAVSNSYATIDHVNSTYWYLPDSMSTGEILYKSDDKGGEYWGDNILWNEAEAGWAVIIDDAGKVVDYVAWQWGASEIAEMQPQINGRGITVGDQFMGDGVSSTGSGSIQRVGDEDHDAAYDFDWITPPSHGIQNTDLVVPFAGTGMLPLGLSFDGAAGTIRGTPMEAGTFVFPATVTDSASPAHATTKEFQLEVRTLPPLALDLPADVVEGDGIAEGIVGIAFPLGTDLSVQLDCDDPSEATVPTWVTIGAGQTEAAFDVTIVDDDQLDWIRQVTISAAAPGHVPAMRTLAVHDNETAGLAVHLPLSASETDGVLTGGGMVVATAAPVTDVVVELSSDNTAEVTVPPTVTIRAGQDSVTFDVTVVDDSRIDGSQTVTISARVENWTEGSGSLEIMDDESVQLVVRLSADAWEGAGVLAGAGVVIISGTLPEDLPVLLSCDDPSELQVPAEVTIPAGKTFATFDLTVVDDADEDGVQMVEVTARAIGFLQSNDWISVGDDELHHFDIQAIHTPQTVKEPFDVTVAARDVNGGTILVYHGTAGLSGRVQRATDSTIVISEVDTSSPDRAEFTNVSGREIDVSNWQVVFFDRQFGTSPLSPLTIPPGTICPAAGVFVVCQKGTAPGVYPDFYTGEEISWRPDGSLGVLLLDAAGDVVDFMAAATLDPAEISDPQTLVPDHWQGSQVPSLPDESVSYQRVGDADHDDASDWVTAGANIGSANPGLAVPFATSTQTVPVTPSHTTAFTDGAWTGEVTIHGLEEDLVLVADDGSGHTATSNPFDVVPGPVDHFQFSAISSPQYVGAPFAVTLTALDAHDFVASGFQGPVALTGLEEDSPVAVSPTSTGSFVDGVWSGQVSVLQQAAGVVLRADDFAGHISLSDSFDVETLPPLTLSIPAEATEGDGTVQGTVSIPAPLGEDLTVHLLSDDMTEATVPTEVTITAGATQAGFPIAIVDDSELDGIRQVGISASAAGHGDGSAAVAVHDNETATLTVQLPLSATEGDGVLVGQGRVTASGAPTSDVAVQLSSDDTSEVTVPATVTIPAGQTSAAFDVTVVDDVQIDGLQTATVTAHLENWTDGSDTIEVIDNEAASLDMILLMPEAWEGDGVIPAAGMLFIGGDLPTDLMVSLASDDTSELVVPATVIIPAGAAEAWFDLTIVDDAVCDGPQPVTVTATAAGFNGAVMPMMVWDNDVHHFTLHIVDSPQTACEPFEVTVEARDLNGTRIPVYAGTANLSGWADGGTGSTIVISEVASSSPDTMEFTNVSGQDVDVSGWQVVVYDRTSGTSPLTTLTIPPETICPANDLFLLYQRGTAPGTYPNFYTGANVSWRPDEPLGVLLLDAGGGVVDFMAAAGLDPSQITDPLAVVPDDWQGSQVPSQPDDTQNYLRTDQADHDNASDWICGSPSIGQLNPGLTVPFVVGGTPLPVTPPVTAAFAGGVWTGQVAVQAVADQVVLRAEDAGHTGSSGPFDVVPGPIDHFEFSTIDSPQRVGRPLTVTLTARDTHDFVATGFAGPVGLAGWAPAGGDRSFTWLGRSAAFEGEPSVVGISPRITGGFVDGVWTGEVAVLEAADQMVLRADDRQGHVSESNPFDVEALPGEIRGRKFHDRNADGDRDADEEALEGWKIYLDLNQNGQWDVDEPYDLTDGDGQYSFAGLVPRTYTVAEVPADDWGQTFPDPAPELIRRLSVAADAGEGSGASSLPAVSRDGRFVAFESEASNLVPGDSNASSDVFVSDGRTGMVQRVSVAADGTQGNGASTNASISADGRYVAFCSDASNLIAGDTNGHPDVFVYDRQTDVVQRVSVAADGTQGNDPSGYPAISADGRSVAFRSFASNLVPGDTNGQHDLFVYDRQAGAIERVSVASDGTQADDGSHYPSISADGRWVAFSSRATSLVSGDTNGEYDVFVHDRQTGATERVSIAWDGSQGNLYSSHPAITADGRYVAYHSAALNLVPQATGPQDVFVFDRYTGLVQCVSGAAGGLPGNGDCNLAGISADGRFVAFDSTSSNLVPGDANGSYDVFVHDRQTGTTRCVSQAADGSPGNVGSFYPSISADGRYVAFASNATDLVPGDANGHRDVFASFNTAAGLPGAHTVLVGSEQIVEGIDFGNRNLAGPLDHFRFSEITSPQYAEVPLGVTLEAVDAEGRRLIDFDGSVELSGWIGFEVPPTLVISECGDTSPDFVEIQSVAGQAVDTAGWVVALNHAENGDANAVHDVYWHLPDSIAPGEVLYRTDRTDDQYWGSNIWWGARTGKGWAMIVDDAGSVVDFVAWGYSGTEITEMDVVINGHPVTVGSQWIGEGIDYGKPTAQSLQRVGNEDHDDAGDFAWVGRSRGQQNSALVQPFLGGPVTVTVLPATAALAGGLWSGEITVLEAAEQMHLLADDRSQHASFSNTFDVEWLPPLSVELPAGTTEGDGVVQGSLRIPAPLVIDLPVSLFSDDTSEATVPPAVTILAGRLEATFEIAIVDDAELDGAGQVTISASAAGSPGGSGTMTVGDNETAVLAVELPDRATEGDGLLAAAGTVTVDQTPTRDVVVRLNSDDATELTVPATVAVPAGQRSATFDVTIVDDNEIDGPQTATVTATVENWTAGWASIEVADNETPDLVVELPSHVWEGDGVLADAATVRILGTLPADLVVWLSCDDPGELEVPATVTIPAGEVSAWFDLTIVDDAVCDGVRQVTVTASAIEFFDGRASLAVADNDAHHFAFDPVDTPQLVMEPFGVTIRARDINGEAIPVFAGTVALSAGGAAGPLNVDPAVAGPFVGGFWTAEVTVDGVDANVVLRADDGSGHTGSSNAFDVTAGPVDHFRWEAMPSPRSVNTPFEATLTAEDAHGFTATGFEGSVELAAWTGGGTASTVAITELGLGTPDYIEIQNLSGRDLDTSGWVVAVSGSSTNVNLANSTCWELPSAMAAGQLAYKTDDDQDHAWGANINWVPGKAGWAIIIDGAGEVVDFVAWQWTAADIAEMDAQINGHSVAPGEQFLGDGAPSTGPGSLQRRGNEDHNTGSDFAWVSPPTRGAENQGLLVPFIDGAASIPVTPTVLEGFVDGVWSGQIMVHRDAAQMILRVDGGKGYVFDSDPFDVEPLPYEITGHKFDDRDGNGAWDPDEQGLPGWEIYLDLNGNGGRDPMEPFDRTDESGSYGIQVTPGSYAVAEVSRRGWDRTLPGGDGTYTVDVDVDWASYEVNFGNHELPAEIRGAKWSDLNGDGVRDAGEPGLADWKIYLDENFNGRWDSGEPYQLTDAGGGYWFGDLRAGTYAVAEVPRDGWRQTYPGGGAAGAVTAFSAAPRQPGLAAISTTASTAPVFPASQSVLPGDAADLIPATSLSGTLIHLDQFRADPRFEDTDGSGLAAVILDTGMDLDHPFFGPDLDGDGTADRIVYQWDFGDGDSDASDHNGHGTNVTSIVASQDATYVGMAPGVDIISLKVFPDSGEGDFAAVEEALQWVVANAATYNVVTVNMSIGDAENYTSARSLYGIGDELAALAALNVIVVSASGNDFYTFDSVQGVTYPSADPNSLSIGAVYDSGSASHTYGSGAVAHSSGADRIAPFSQRHATLTTVFAPGAPITGAGPSGTRLTMHGTSQAAPHVAGVAVLAQDLAVHRLGRRLTPTEFKSLLADSAVTINDGDDEDDNVANTGLDFPRVDVLALAEAISAMGGLSGVHTVLLDSGQVVEGVDFGNRPPAEVAGRYVFYNNSDFDGHDPQAGTDDDHAIAPDPSAASGPELGKTALLPGQRATFRNYTSYNRGINGIMVDIAHGLITPTARDFQFKIGNDDHPSGWEDAPAPTSVTVRKGAGPGGSDRVTAVWEDYAIVGRWLEVTVRGKDIGLFEDDVFYFGNAPGESGDSTDNAIVNSTDEILGRSHLRGPRDPAAVDDRYDFNRDKLVNSSDRIIARTNRTRPDTCLRLITPPAAAGGRELAQSGITLAHDIVLQRGAARGTDPREISLGKLAWLYEFEQIQMAGRPSGKRESAQQVVDRLLAVGWA